MNEEKLLPDAVASVFAQTYPSWELILVDDGSSDNGFKLAMKYHAGRPNQVHCLQHSGGRHRGLSASRNLGINAAKGEYISFIDADDLWLPDKLEEQVAIMDRNRTAGMICGASRYLLNWEEDAEEKQKETVVPVGLPGNLLFSPPFLLTKLYPLSHGAAPCPSGLLLRREVIHQVGGFEESFNGEMQLYEDQAFLAKIYLSSPVFVSSAVFDVYRVRRNSIMARVIGDGKYHVVRQNYLQWLEAYIQAKKFNDPVVRRALRRSLFRYRHHIIFALIRNSRKAASTSFAFLCNVCSFTTLMSFLSFKSVRSGTNHNSETNSDGS